jgi:hypothetical protein
MRKNDCPDKTTIEFYLTLAENNGQEKFKRFENKKVFDTIK